MRKFMIKVNGQSYQVEVEELTQGTAAPEFQAAETQIPAPVSQAVPSAAQAVPAPAKAAEGGAKVPEGAEAVSSPLPGTVLSVRVAAGDSVKRGDVLLLIESMKMENEIMAPRDGKILSVVAAKDTMVNTGDLLLVIG